VTPVVIDASAGVEILANTAHGRRLARLLPTDAVGWVPEHFYVEVAGVVRHQTVVARTLTEEAAATVLGRLERWHLRRAQPGPLITAAWRFRHNMTMADAVYVALAAELGGALLTDDHRLVNSPGFPTNVSTLTLDRS
jgi:predicted nucleic acid-binding protein